MNPFCWAELPEKQSDVPVDLLNPGKCQIHGAFFLNCPVGDSVRKLLIYIPESWGNNDEVLVIAPPSCLPAEKFLADSGLVEFTRQRGVLAAILVREPHKSTEEEAHFMNTAYKKLQGREYFVAMQDCFYAMGVGDGSPVALKAMLSMGNDWSGAALLGGIRDVTEEPVIDEADKGIQTEEMFISGKKSQLPIWLLEEKETPDLVRVRDYWIRENQDVTEPVFDPRGTAVYLPKPISPTSSLNDAPIAQVRVTLGFQPESLSASLLNQVWDYTGAARRHRSYHKKVLRYFRNPDIPENGATYHTMVVDGMKREWYEYVPRRFRQSDTPLPLVVAFHGRGGNGKSFFDISDLSVAAEERGFIALFPTADIYQIRPDGYRGVRLWNGNYKGADLDSMPFVRAMIEDVKGRLPVDESRIYACGQSSGGYMAVCCAFQAPDLFAAVAPWSGFVYPGMKSMHLPLGAPQQLKDVPVYLLIGKQDTHFGAPSIDLSHPSSALEEFLLFVLDSYGLSREYDSYTCYPIDYYVWKRNGIPMVTLGLIDDMPHANYAEESRISYDDFMCRFSMDPDGSRRYMGKKIK